MENMGKEYKKILENLEERLKDNPDFEYIKSEFTNLFMLFFNEVDSLRKLYEDKIEVILDRQSRFDEKLNRLEEMTNNLEKEMLNDETDEMIRSMLNNDDDEEEYEECEVCCPYCSEIFFIDTEELNKETSCPYCNNIIELDWTESSDEN